MMKFKKKNERKKEKEKWGKIVRMDQISGTSLLTRKSTGAMACEQKKKLGPALVLGEQ